MTKNCLAQVKDTIATGYLPDAAEEYWPSKVVKGDLSSRVNHIEIRKGKGFLSGGCSYRQGYDLFDNYLWGIGPQDGNGYFLQRANQLFVAFPVSNFFVICELTESLTGFRSFLT